MANGNFQADMFREVMGQLGMGGSIPPTLGVGGTNPVFAPNQVQQSPPMSVEPPLTGLFTPQNIPEILQQIPQQIPQQPLQQPQEKVIEEEKSQKKKDGLSPFARNMIDIGIPLAAAIAGSVNPDLLPQTAGLATGFTEERSRQGLEQKELEREQLRTQQRLEKEADKERKEARREAQEVAKIVADSFPRISPEEQLRAIDEIEKRILEQRGIPSSQSTEEITEKVKSKVLNIEGAPSAKGRKDGSKLKDESGNVIAIAQDGQWQSLQ